MEPNHLKAIFRFPPFVPSVSHKRNGHQFISSYEALSSWSPFHCCCPRSGFQASLFGSLCMRPYACGFFTSSFHAVNVWHQVLPRSTRFPQLLHGSWGCVIGLRLPNTVFWIRHLCTRLVSAEQFGTGGGVGVSLTLLPVSPDCWVLLRVGEAAHPSCFPSHTERLFLVFFFLRCSFLPTPFWTLVLPSPLPFGTPPSSDILDINSFHIVSDYWHELFHTETNQKGITQWH